jgi:curved DNA-binding protein CbpA
MSSYDPAELMEEADIDSDRKKAILETYYRLDLLNHYELLGVEQTADKRLIKNKYYEVVNVFHPDRYYGKKLGSFKPKLERVFQRLTEAHEVLSRHESRAEYDAYLNAERRTQALDRKLHDEEAYARELREAQERIEAEARAETPSSPLPREARVAEPVAQTLSSAPPIQALRSSVPSIPPSGSPRVEIPKADPDARRRALARKLGLSSPPPPVQRAAPARATDDNGMSGPKRAAEELKRRYEQRMLDARRRQVSEYEARAEAALGAGNLIDAVNAMRVAVSLVPDQVALKNRLNELEREAARELSERYLEQALYEEREKRWTDAARSYARAHTGKPNARVSERLANALLMAQGDTRRALEHARAAVLENPNDPKFRVTLARAYLAAKMRESALGELERAATLAPGDDSIRDQIRRVKRGEY